MKQLQQGKKNETNAQRRKERSMEGREIKKAMAKDDNKRKKEQRKKE